MRPETSAYLDKARRDLGDARAVADIGLSMIAARSAYYAAFHAAEAFIVERTGKIAKTHSGVRSKLAELSRTDHTIDRDVLTFWARLMSTRTSVTTASIAKPTSRWKRQRMRSRKRRTSSKQSPRD